jgi:hypothetical protein
MRGLSMRIPPIGTSALIVALCAAGVGPCACRGEPAAREAAISSPTSRPVVAEPVEKREQEGKRDAGAADASPDAGSGDRGGLLCVAPLDYSETPGKGAMAVDMTGGFDDGPSPTPRNARAIVKVDGVKREITLKKGARFDGLPLDEPVEVTIASPGQRPYIGKKISFAKEGARALCLYENPFYATVQISDVPRRPFCRRCFKERASGRGTAE